jgi:hypothetical protein
VGATGASATGATSAGDWLSVASATFASAGASGIAGAPAGAVSTCAASSGAGAVAAGVVSTATAASASGTAAAPSAFGFENSDPAGTSMIAVSGASVAGSVAEAWPAGVPPTINGGAINETADSPNTERATPDTLPAIKLLLTPASGAATAHSSASCP